MADIRKDLLSSSKALLDLDADGVLVPHGIGGHARACLSWGIDEIERLRSDNERLRAALREIAAGEVDNGGNCRVRWDSIEIARRALEGKE